MVSRLNWPKCGVVRCVLCIAGGTEWIALSQEGCARAVLTEIEGWRSGPSFPGRSDTGCRDAWLDC